MTRSRAYLVIASLSLMTTLVVLLDTAPSSARSAGPFYSDTIHQSAGDRDSRGTPKYYQHSSMSGAYASAVRPPPEHDFQLEGR